MKKLLFSLVLFALVLSGGPLVEQVSAKGEEAGGGKPPKMVRAKPRAARADANEIRRYRERRQEMDAKRDSERRKRRMKEREKIRQMRQKKLGKTESAGDTNRPSAKGAKGMDRQQQLEKVKQQIGHEESKHLKRLARMQRIRELAGDDSKTIARLDKLMQKEQLRYDRKLQRLERGLRRMKGERVRPPGRKPLSREARDAMRRPEYRKGGKYRPRPAPKVKNKEAEK